MIISGFTAFLNASPIILSKRKRGRERKKEGGGESESVF